MAKTQAQFPRVLSAAPEPLGWYLRPSYVDHRAIADAVAGRSVGLHGAVFDPLYEDRQDRHSELRHLRVERNRDAILDPRTQELGSIGGFNQRLSALPWALDRPHGPDDFHSLGVPLIGDMMGGLRGLSALAFGAVGGICHGVTQKERFSASSWTRPASSSNPGFTWPTRIYVAPLGIHLKREEATAFFGARGPATDAAVFAESLSFDSQGHLAKRMSDNRKVLERLRVGLGRFVQEGPVVSFSQIPLRRAMRG